jgi:predicted DNA binding CopG/RHH family protein
MPTYRQIMEKKIGRSLLPPEVVHHIDGNRENNNIENLLLLPSPIDHVKIHVDQRFPIENRKTERLEIRIPSEDKEILKNKAAAQGMSLAAYLLYAAWLVEDKSPVKADKK